MGYLQELIAQNRAGKAVAIASVCSAQADVLEASLLLAKSRNRPILIEATSNQVNQFGGYTGMTPADFIAFVGEIMGQVGIDPALVIFGGDHLGPQVWRVQPASKAMENASDLMAAYVKAGFTKIHLDCSEGCAGEPAQVDDLISARRAAMLARVCEENAPDPGKLSYVIGTEVPPPGGARADEIDAKIVATTSQRAKITLAQHQDAFDEIALVDAWKRVIGLVVQPGLEFGPTRIDRLNVGSANELSAALQDFEHICFEAHSTDYQYDGVFPELARRNFAVLKVGPALTFAYRQALYALDHLSHHLAPGRSGTELSDTMEQLMLGKPEYWQNHYAGSESSQYQQRHFGYADRIRYYWPEAKAQAAIAVLFSTLGKRVPPRPMLEQYFAPEILRQAGSLDEDWAKQLVKAQIQQALTPYLF